MKMIRSVLAIPEEKYQVIEFSNPLSRYDRKILEDMAEILSPFEEATDFLQGQNCVTISYAIPCIRGLHAHLEEMSSKFNCKLVSSLKASLQKRMKRFEERDLYSMAASLDTAFKLDWCNPSETSRVKELLHAKLTANEGVEVSCASGNSPVRKRTKLFSFMKPTVPSEGQQNNSGDGEIHQYFNQPCELDCVNPLLYWKENQHNFPGLAKLAAKYLAVPASSSPVERVFSIAGKIFRPERCSLSDKTFEELMFIRSNSHILG